MKAIEDGYYRDEISKSKTKTAKRLLASERDIKLEKLRKAFEEEKAKKLESLKDRLGIAQLESMEKEFTNKKKEGNPIYQRIFEAGKGSPLYESSFQQFLSGKLLKKWEVDFEEYRKYHSGKQPRLLEAGQP